MKVHAVTDASGKVLSTFEVATNGTTIEPVLLAGQKVHEIDVPDNYKTAPDHVFKS